MEITILNVQRKSKMPEGYEELLRKCVSHVCETEGLSDNYEVGITIMDDQDIMQLNRDYRGINAPTDVLSFALAERLEGEPEIIDCGGEGPLILGDIVISAQAVERQAEEYGHSVTRELCFLVVHGMLHLLGYDHDTPDRERLMIGRQKRVLDDLKIFR